MTDVKRIESYGLFDFCQDVEAAFKEGYVFDFSTNENFPTAYGTMLTCGLVKAVEVTEVETADEAKTEVEEVVQETAAVTSVVEEVVQEVEQVSTDVEQTTEEVTEVKEPAKRGPKPKNK